MSGETDLIKERINIAEVVGEYVQLRQAGRHFKGLCPFHSEKTPSFVVSPDRGIWHCFGSCAEGGDVFSFVQKMEGVEFSDALKMLADRAGVTLQQQATGPRRDERVRQYEVLSLALRLYEALLFKHQAGAKALAYLRERGVQDTTMRAFHLGYAPQRWDTLQQFFRQQGVTEAEMLASGLVGRSERGTLYDRFRGRIMFPIFDVQGRVVAFGGRIVPWHETGEEGKYINSPETKIYEKRRVVYNLQRAKRVLRQYEPCIIVEGYMDVVMLVQAGVENVVATSGTALTREHVTLLKRYTNTLHFAFDADKAGLQAAEHATQEAVAAGMRVATILFPAGKDPADVVKDEPDKVAAYLSQTTSVVEVLLGRLKSATGAADRQTLLEHVLPFVAAVSNPVQQGEMIQEIAVTLHVPEAMIVEQLVRHGRQRIAAVASDEPRVPIAQRLAPGHLLLGLLILEPTLRAAFWAQVHADDFLDDQALSLYKQMQRLAETQPTFLQQSADTVISALPESSVTFAEGVRRVAEEHVQQVASGLTRDVKMLLRALRVAHLERRLTALHEQLAQAEVTARESLLREFQAVARELSQAQAQV